MPMHTEVSPYVAVESGFRAYLLNKYESSEVGAIMAFTSEALPGFMRQLDNAFSSLYTISDKSQVNDYIHAISTNVILKNDDAQQPDIRYSDVLREYRRYLSSKFHPEYTKVIDPRQVPGENEDNNDEQFEPEPEHDQMDRGQELLYEGEITTRNVKLRRRSQELRRRCIEYFKDRHGGQVVCECCGFNFSKAYGTTGEGYIEVHHLEPISTTGGIHPVDYQTKLVPLCSNCHSMIHRRPGGGVYDLEGLKEIYQGLRYDD